MAERDLYAELGLKKGANKDEIKKAYRKLARELHPDRNPNNPKAEERFKRVAYANDVLSDVRKRGLYDEFGEQGLREGFDVEAARAINNMRSGAGRSGASFEEIFGNAGPGAGAKRGRSGFGGTLEDLFGGNIDELFGRGGMGGFGNRAGGAASGGAAGKVPDQESEITIGFDEAMSGVEKELTIQEGQQQRRLRVRIPAGVSDGGKVRLRGQGSRRGNAAGDLVLTVKVSPHELFRREGDDLHLDLPLTLSEAWRGATIKVPTPAGEVALKIPARAQGGAKLRLRGKGVAKRDGTHGDLLVHLQLRLPDGRDHEAIGRALESLDGQYASDVRSALKSRT
ncbi:MAG: DnaJ C-terminal domain-containing protein [Myxococcales bacterium]